ncbi:hypothetical protein K502DRAFT_329433 [Neoconidiobolus thromboides FSU 785]|nr:hypothetical protein K502DRAFT_329433 [Neoconidiobolus thromboides FSU 785]
MAKVTSSNPFDLLGDFDYDGDVKAKAQSKGKKETAPASAPAKTQARGKGATGARQGNDFDAPRAPRNNDKKRHTKNPAPRRGREFDRHSGTGRVDTEKAVENFVGKATENYDEATKDEASKDDAATPEESPVEPEDNSKTLDEYYAELAAAKADKEEKEARKANEGTDDSKWKDGVVLKKADEDFFTGKGMKKAQKKEKVVSKTFLDIEQKFNEPQREQRENRGPREQRGGRGGQKGGRGNNRGGNANRGNNRGGAKNAPRPIPLNDQNAFPSLGSN